MRKTVRVDYVFCDVYVSEPNKMQLHVVISYYASNIEGRHASYRYVKLVEADTYFLHLCSRDIVSGVLHLHELGIVHRDLKPQNVLIVKERGLCAKVSDMGISKRLHENMSSFQQVTGKLFCLALHFQLLHVYAGYLCVDQM